MLSPKDCVSMKCDTSTIVKCLKILAEIKTSLTIGYACAKVIHLRLYIKTYFLQ